MSVRRKYKQNRRMRKLRKPTVLFPLIAFALLCFWAVSCAMRDRGQKMLPRETLTIINAKGAPCVFIVELAVTPEEQEEGLMYRRSLAADAGMLFVFPKPQIADFWMKNTVLPLDMIFIRKTGVVDSIAENAASYSVANIFSAGPVIATLEVPAGSAARLDLQPSDRVLASQFTTN
jgi:uncharacterized membrane protein (UPF0127 family)